VESGVGNSLDTISVTSTERAA